MLSCIKLRVVVAPLVVILFGNLARLQHGSGLLPGTEHLVQSGGVLALPHIDFQAYLYLALKNNESCLQRQMFRMFGV